MERVHRSLLASAEKRTLVWMAERLPKWLNSGHLTVLGFVSSLVVGASYRGPALRGDTVRRAAWGVPIQ